MDESDSVDAFTQRLLERARQRRKNLQEKLGESPAIRKRPVPLGDSQVDNLPPIQDDDSPKRHCTREMEQSIKTDTPAIQSVRSRRTALTDHYSQDTVVTSCSPPRQVRPPPEPALDDNPRTPITGGNRRARLAALAQNINSWEDDLRKTSTTPKAEEKPRRVWQRPEPHPEDSAPPARRGSPVKEQRSPIKERHSPVKERHSPIKERHSSSKQTIATAYTIKATRETHTTSLVVEAPAKPPRTYEEEAPMDTEEPPAKPSRTFDYQPPCDSPLRESKSASAIGRNSPKRVISEITVNLGPNEKRQMTGTRSASGLSAAERGLPSARRNAFEAGEDDDDELTQKPISERLAAWKQKDAVAKADATKQTPAKKWPTVNTQVAKVKQSHTENRRDSTGNEPTKLPVQSRLAAWQSKVDKEQHEERQVSPTRRSPVKVTPTPMTSKVTQPTVKVTQPPVKPSSPVKWQPIAASQGPEPRWSPVKAPGSVSPAKRAASPVKPATPSQAASAARSIQDRLVCLKQNMQTPSSAATLAEAQKQQRQAEINQLANRWKNGMLQEDDQQPEPQQEPVSVPSYPSEVPPPPPPAPPMPAERLRKGTSPVKAPVSARREQARDKIRSEFEGKLQAMGFDVTPGSTASLDLTPQRKKEKEQRVEVMASPELTRKAPKVIMTETKVTTTTFGADKVISNRTVTHEEVTDVHPSGSVPPVQCSTKTIQLQPAPQPSSSIYSLIKTGGASAASTEGAGSTNTASRDFPAYAAQLAARTRQPSQDDTSLDDSQESQYSESQSEYTEYTGDNTDHFTEEATETEDCYTEATETEDNYGDGESSESEDESEYTDEDEDEEESEDEDGAVDDLLDEAMEDTIVTETETESEMETHRPVPQPRGSRDQGSTSSQHRVTFAPGSSPQKQRAQQGDFRSRYDSRQQNFYASQQSNYRRPVPSSSIESDSDQSSAQVISVELYRNSKKNAPPPPKMTIVRHSEQTKRMSVNDEPLPYIPEKSVKEKLQELQALVNAEQNVIMQTSNALNQCCGSNSAFAGSPEAVECHRLLLIACKKREAYMMEMQRLRDGPVKAHPTAAGSLTISDIRLPLKAKFLEYIGTPADTSTYFFITLIRQGAHVILTQMMNTHDTMVRGALEFPNLIKLNNITQDFKLDLEIYSMCISREDPRQTPSKKKRGLTPKKNKLFGAKAHQYQSPGGPNAVHTTNFAQIASLPITMRVLNKTHFSLDRVPFSSPLQGSIHLRFKCLMEANVEERGFLTMFEDVSGFGAWHRRWMVLKGGRLFYWKYPDDERTKEPMGSIDLKQCITGKVGLIPRDICARPNTFELLTVRRQSRGDANTLTTQCRDTMTTCRHQLSADTKEDRLVWCDQLNEALHNLRTWHPDAMRPISRN